MSRPEKPGPDSRRAGAADSGRVDVSEPASISSGIASRYATALFELADESGGLPALEADVGTLASLLGESEDLRAMIASPLHTREEQGAAIDAVAAAAGLSALMQRTLALMAAHRRLFVLPQLVTALRSRIAAAKGEETAEVTAARALTPEQEARLADLLSAKVGKTVKLQTTVDETLIGGLVVKVGSKMIDTSIRSKLASLQNAMKEVG